MMVLNEKTRITGPYIVEVQHIQTGVSPGQHFDIDNLTRGAPRTTNNPEGTYMHRERKSRTTPRLLYPRRGTMSLGALFVCLLQPWSLSGLIMPSTDTSSLLNDVASLKQSVASLQSTTRQLQKDLQSTKSDLHSAKDQVSKLSKNVASKIRDVAFHVSKPAPDQTTYTPLTFGTILYNSGSGYNFTSGVFTVPVSGTYMFWTKIEINESDAYLNVWILTAGKEEILASGWVLTDSTIDDAAASAKAVVRLKRGEEVWVEITVKHTLVENDASYFGGVLLSVH
ncbi:caprin-2-like isoform X1 [Haliotis cracherodii]|uniref:caprin-2-like isoform X1 n=1 Tax=Haliotis cracherodii TaxID=6455 RepID=UPI0039EAB6AC